MTNVLSQVGEKTISLAGLNAIKLSLVVGSSWIERFFGGADQDVDGVLLMLNKQGVVQVPSDFVFYGQNKSSCGAITHRLSLEDGEEYESIEVVLGSVPKAVERMIFAVSLHNASDNELHFGMISDLTVCVADKESQKTLLRIEQPKDVGLVSAISLAEISRQGEDWELKLIKQGYEGGLPELIGQYGLGSKGWPKE
ncbi:TerD family protein [Aeromonas sp. MrichA-1]|uniref:TerD family protein n=1 Tax=Aeromonas sp. MrichA-1 TaxID=2823362 RepID=UPI001B343B2C|nr:TerD family protein [Aeromonas sp. MrichA-1]MBP4081874.1 TerD family protein [Aeromonas sp. MrichA-1]